MYETATSFKDVQSFISNFKLPVLAKVLLKTIDDCQLFYLDFYQKNTHLIDDLLDYRTYKLSTTDLSLKQYLKICFDSGIKSAFETTFLQLFSVEEIDFIEKAINRGDISLEKVYNSFQENKNQNILKHIL